MVFVEHLGRKGKVVLDLGFLGPRQVDERVDVVAHHGRFGGHRRHQLELLELGVDFLARFLRHLRRDDLLFEILHVGALFPVAELFLDRLDLLVQVVLALALLHLALDSATDPFFHLKDVNLVFQLLEQFLESLIDCVKIQNCLLNFQLQRQVRRDRVGQPPGIVDSGDRRQDLRRNLLVELDVLIELLGHSATQRFDLGFGVNGRRHRRQLCHEVLAVVADAVRVGALDAFNQNLDSAVGQLKHLQDA